MLTLMTVPLTDLDMVADVGNRIENNVIGTNGVDNVEQIVDKLVPSSADGYSQSELAVYTGVYNVTIKTTHPKTTKPRTNPRA